MNTLSIVLFSFVFIINAVNSNSNPEVEIKDGKLQGKFMVTRTGRKFSGFLAIPFAKPPLGELRFKAPVRNDPWKGVRDATKDSPVCYQRNPYTRSEIIEGDEDCLYLNVYTPQLPSFGSDPLPVMVFFHGGGWVCGAGTSMWYGPDILLDRDVVLVVPNFRLGPLGFISTGDDVVPGNTGMKDQAAALRWVKNNIAKFGGDPDKITLFGESAGGASTEYHMMSPLSKDVVAGGISQSGTGFCTWALAPKGETRKNTEKLAKAFDCPTDNSKEMVDCLRKVDARDIIDKDKIFWVWDTDPMIPFKPMIEHEHEGAFLSKHPEDIIKDGEMKPVPWITGVTSSEGALRVASIASVKELLEDLEERIIDRANVTLLQDLREEDVHKIKKFYFKNQSMKLQRQNIVDLYTDAWFLHAMDEAVQLHIENVPAPTYVYYFDHRGVASFSQIFGDPHKDYGVCHADDLQYLFPVSDGLFPDQPPDEHDKLIAQILTSLWVSFAKTGSPTAETGELLNVEWKPTTSSSIEYLHIGGVDDIKMESSLLPDRIQFWRDLQVKHHTRKIWHEEL